MASDNLPIALQERIMFFAGDIPSSSNITNDTPPSVLVQCVPGGVDSRDGELPRSDYERGRVQSTQNMLSPSDLYLLTQNDGPGFVILDNFLGVNKAQEVMVAAMNNKDLKPAGMGRGLGKFVDTTTRGDLTTWLSPLKNTTTESLLKKKGLEVLLGAMDIMKQQLVPYTPLTSGYNNKANNDGGAEGDQSNVDGDIKKNIPKRQTLKRLSHQLARYPGNATGYVRHRDAYPSEDGSGRWLTALYYFNPDWLEEYGGSLRVYIPNTGNQEVGGEEFYDIVPKMDRLVVFRADRLDHEVLATHRDRFAIATWFSLEPRIQQQTAVTPKKTETQAADMDQITVSDENSRKGDSASSSSSSCMSSVQLSPQICPATTTPSIFSHVSVVGGDDTPHPSIALRKPLPIPNNPTSLDISNSGGSGDNKVGDSDTGNKVKAKENSTSGSIFVSIASYRDPECQHTLRDIFDTAQFPDRVFVGVVGQYDDEKDSHCFTDVPLPSKYAKQVRCLSLKASDAKGPCWARYLAQRLYRDESFILQIDSHMRFRPNWDSYLVAMLDQCPSTRSIITTYPPGYTTDGMGGMKSSVQVPSDVKPTVLCPKYFGSDGMLRQGSKTLRQIASQPIRSFLWAGGFNFGKASDVLTAPYDPHLLYLFFGEEISMAARLWTHGIDCYAPPETVCYHLWSRALRPIHAPSTPGSSATNVPVKAASDNSVIEKRNSLNRVRRLLSMHVQENMASEGSGGIGEFDGWSQYGLGNVRSLSSFESSLGVLFNPQNPGIDHSEQPSTSTSSINRNSAPHQPRVVSKEAKWGGLSPELFDETRMNALLAALGVSLT